MRGAPAAVALVAALAAGTPAVAAVAFSALRDGIWRVYVQETPGTPPRPIAEGLTVDGTAPAFSPDGRWVAFELPAAGLRLCPRRGDGECRDVRAEGGWSARPAWHPSSGELVFVRYVADAEGEDSDIYSTQEALAASRPLLTQTGNQDFPDLSPDGRLLVYSSAQTIALRGGGVQVVQQLWLADLETGRARQLASADAQDIHPAWSPAGDRIAFASDRSGGFEIWVVGADGRNPRRLTMGPGVKTWPTWSPDGKSLLYSRSEDGRQTLWQIDADGANPRPFEPFGPGADVELRDPDWR